MLTTISIVLYYKYKVLPQPQFQEDKVEQSFCEETEVMFSTHKPFLYP